ncbi:MAG: signal recognition particle receptor subunit alpha [Nanoarchaeota archaeon]|nr:signal recognition particle receptor subunit alpha [Nanoarchaeota archaeon]MBU1501215.1 signal recognition particle receptor subunit alpha [Nanoarchaeota archaeon]MBU2459074.1 signal recognition particle receptor subunit alpha [Nanoarchaeota archaeon]
MLEKLGEVLRKATDKIANAIFLDKGLVDSIIKDLQRALIEADVSIALVKELSDKVRKAAVDERIKGIDKKEHMIKVLHDELTQILGEHKQLKLQKGKQNRILLLGLYGAGKTTTTTKLGNYFSKRGNKVLLVGLDTQRPAAAEQLEQNAKKNKLPYIIDTDEKNPVKLWKKHEKEFKDYDLVIADTAGRHTLDKSLIDEIKALDKSINPTERILIIPGDIGQAAKRQAKEFLEAVNITGVIVTRMDSTARGGGALTACAETKAPVYFLTTGEKINDLEEFNPKNFISRLLGMGDLETLLEKIKSATGEDSEEKLKKMKESGKLSLDDVVEQVKSMNSLGGFEKIKSMIPGFSNMGSKIPEGALESQEAKIAKWEHIIKSMTSEEKAEPGILEKQTSRIARIAKGSGVATSDVRALLKQYKLLNEMVKSFGAREGMDEADLSSGMSQKQMMKLAKKFGKVKRMKF